MQVNLTPQQNQSFGMSLSIGEKAQKFLKNQGLSNKEIDKLADLADKQAKNSFNVHIDYDVNSNKLKADIFDGKTYYEPAQEGFLARLLSSPVKFIEKCCNKADALNRKFSGNDKLDDIFSKLD